MSPILSMISASIIRSLSQEQLTSLVVKFGALLFIVYIPTQYVLNFQLLGGLWILQTLPAVFLGLYTRWFNRWALLIAWAVAMISGTWMFIATGLTSAVAPFSIGPLVLVASPVYEAISALVINLILAVILTPIFEAIGARRGEDVTSPTDYDEETLTEPVEAGKEALG